MKALKQRVKIFFKLERFDEMMKEYKKLLTYVQSEELTRNEVEKSLMHVIEHIALASQNKSTQSFLEGSISSLTLLLSAQLCSQNSTKLR